MGVQARRRLGWSAGLLLLGGLLAAGLVLGGSIEPAAAAGEDNPGGCTGDWNSVPGTATHGGVTLHVSDWREEVIRGGRYALTGITWEAPSPARARVDLWFQVMMPHAGWWSPEWVHIQTFSSGSYSAPVNHDSEAGVTEGYLPYAPYMCGTLPPYLTVVNGVVNDNGGSAAVGDWTMAVTGVNPSPASFAGSVAGSTVTLSPGAFSVNGTGPAGYGASIQACERTFYGQGACTPAPAAACSGQAVMGHTYTCLVTYDDLAPSLTLKKLVYNNDGGHAGPSMWTLAATGPTSLSGPGPELSSGATFSAGTYTLSESGGPAGYLAHGWHCTGEGNLVGDRITLGLAETAACTIGNDDQQATVTVFLHVVNDDGTSTAVAGDWQLLVQSWDHGPVETVHHGSEAGFTFRTGLERYGVAVESGPEGYEITRSGKCGGSAESGASYTCTLTARPNPTGTLTIVHAATPPDDARFLFTGTASDPAGAPGEAAEPIEPFLLGDPSHPSHTLVEGPGALDYVVTGALPDAGWRFDDVTCTGAAAWGHLGPTLVVSVGRYEQAVCTFRASGQGSIVVRALASPPGAPNLPLFTFDPSWGGPFTLGPGGVFDSGLLAAGSYGVAELVPAGWSLASASCDDGSDPGAIGLSPGETVTCTFTDVHLAPRLCLGLAPTIVGTFGADTLVGTAGDDVIVGLGGADVISGLGGDDRICGGPGADRVDGGAGDDRIKGQGGADSLQGGAGLDRLRGGLGTDTADGGAGADSCRAETMTACE